MLIPLGALTLAGAIGLLTMSPSRQKLRDEVFAKVLPHRRLPTSRSPLDRGAIGGALLVGTGLPLVLLAARAAHLGALVQGAMLIAWALAAPRLFERVMGTSASPGAIGSRGWTLLSAVAAGLGVTIALAHASHYGIGLFAHATQCLDSAGFEHGLAQRILESQTVNASQDLAGVRSKWLYIAMTVCVIPLAEERVFRDVLQRVLVRSFGKRRGVASAAALFGLAHLGVYGAATFDAVLLGVGFGVAYEEAGLVASTLTHALWNLYWLS